MKRSKPKKSQGDQSSPTRTEVRCSNDLERALRELTAACSDGRVDRLEELLESLAQEFNPASVTMTSTNIPDAILKLSSVVEETHKAAQRVFDLVDNQKALLRESEKHTATIATLLTRSPVDVQAVQREVDESNEVLARLHSTTHQLVEAQEFQDLCGQKVDKVIKLLSGLDDRLRLLLSQFRHPLPVALEQSDPEADKDIDQGAADDILKRFGL